MLTLNQQNAEFEKFHRRNTNLKKAATRYIRISECVWLEFKKSNGISNYCNLSKYFMRENITEPEILSDIKSGVFFGLAKVAVRSTESVIKKFESVGWPIIYDHIAVEKDQLNENMRKELENLKQFPLAKQLTLVFNSESILLTSSMIQFYLDIGCEIYNIVYAIEYKKGRPLSNFVKHVTKERIQATGDLNIILNIIIHLNIF